MSQNYAWPSASSVSISAIGPNGLPAPTTSILIGGTDGTDLRPILTDSAGHLIVDSTTVGGATSANQVLEIADLNAIKASTASIDTKLTAPLAVTGPLTDTQLRATAVPVSLASSPLPTGAATEATLAAFSAKTAGAFVPEAFDFSTITYVGTSTDINTVVYKIGGASGTVVATLTMGYDGSNRLSTVTKS
jgi:hypothetical protein